MADVKILKGFLNRLKISAATKAGLGEEIEFSPEDVQNIQAYDLNAILHGLTKLQEEFASLSVG
jgi:hypothetical protein